MAAHGIEIKLIAVASCRCRLQRLGFELHFIDLMAASVIWKRFFSVGNTFRSSRIALVLSGNGVYDGSEIHEASACLVHLSRGGANISIFAPDILQMHVIDHTKGEPNAKDTRNVLVESARIARGKIQPLTDLKASYDAVIFPGGFGVAKNLSNFATAGKDCKVNPQVEKVVRDFHSNKKPIGLCCIAPILAAKLIPKVEITLGMDKDDGVGTWPYSGTVETVKQWDAIHCNTNVDGVVVDKKNLVVTTPAFMCNTDKFHVIHDGIGNMVKAVLNLVKK